MHSPISLLQWVSDLLDEVTIPELIEENGMSPEEQLAWLRDQVALWNVRLEEYWSYLDAQRPEPDPEEEAALEQAIRNDPNFVFITAEDAREKMRELMS